MRVSGDEAKAYRAVRLDSFLDVNKGTLVLADDLTGEVTWIDTPESQKTVTLGAGAIKILPVAR